MANPKKTFVLEINIDWAGAPAGKVVLNCIAYLYADGTMRTVDIEKALYNGNDIADYVSAAHPNTWDEWGLAAEEHFKYENEEPAPVEHDGELGEGYLHTNIN